MVYHSYHMHINVINLSKHSIKQWNIKSQISELPQQKTIRNGNVASSKKLYEKMVLVNL